LSGNQVVYSQWASCRSIWGVENLDKGARVLANRPGVMPRRDREYVTGRKFYGLTAWELDIHPAAHHVSVVSSHASRLAAVGTDVP
jgi:hypothetical protein